MSEEGGGWGGESVAVQHPLRDLHMVYIDWILVLNHPSLHDPPANTGDAAMLWHELKIGLDSEHGLCAHGVFNWRWRMLNYTSIKKFLSSQTAWT